MRRWLTALILVLLTGAPAFGEDAARETLRIGVDPAYPPFSDIDDADRPPASTSISRSRSVRA